ncbi:MAG: hypothetical protein M1828_001296 [Chrysothrix sp. TS-e1954]|nr:MAG: hypothetical protein M1828_001296 [Chrysothrix sp. TS-e1954]
MNRLDRLPTELLSHIAAYLDTAKALASLARVCKRLRVFVEVEGWRAFVLHRFPSTSIPTFWKDGAHALTTLSRNWDRRAFLAHDIEPRQKIHSLPSGEVRSKWRMPSGQTIGFQAIVDSYEVWPGSNWRSRIEVAAWSAGAELVVRSVQRGDDVLADYQSSSVQKRSEHFDDERCWFEWLVFRDPMHSEGKDDITALKLIRPPTLSALDGPKPVIVGRASGELSLFQLSSDNASCTKRTYNTSSASVRSIDVSQGQNHVFLAGLGDERAALYSLSDENEQSHPVSDVHCVDKSQVACRTWSSRLVADDKVAIGIGPSKTPVLVYSVTPAGLSPAPIRAFGTGRSESTRSTSVYPIVPVPDNLNSDHTSGQVFLSGGYDGKIRIHDMRSQNNIEADISDPVDDSAIFSMAAIGRERVIAGASRNSLIKVFDLRMTGGRAYSYMGLDHLGNDLNSREYGPKTGWNVFATQHRNEQTHRAARRQFVDGPVYSLSRPSASSSSLYVGLESRVVHFNFTSMFDNHPDPVFRNTLRFHKGSRNRRVAPIATWWPRPNAHHTFAMYEHARGGSIPILKQRALTGVSNDRFMDHSEFMLRRRPGYDARWITPVR